MKHKPETIDLALGLINAVENEIEEMCGKAGLPGANAKLWRGGLGSPRVTITCYNNRVFMGSEGRRNRTEATCSLDHFEAVINEAGAAYKRRSK